ncbi:hypothetical protein CYMTET_29416 [Cymbomonas tetramitiformis]|uniref:Uncharacterized protein n=1 Tax=Cymbomonas tetramitiformis TaxID=36881 RepID=A0AAE0FL47_9CHLO|nr:hypothetical protein CYMTET_29416 [Cymbomonas tetramitiformis]
MAGFHLGLGLDLNTSISTSNAEIDGDHTTSTELERQYARVRSKPVVVPALFGRASALAVPRRERETFAGTDGDPELAAHERNRKIQKKSGNKDVQRRCGARTSKTEPKKPTLHQRLAEFPQQSLRISGDKLFCGCCKEQLSLIKSSLTSYNTSRKHRENLVKYVEVMDSDHENLIGVLTEYFAEYEDEAMSGLRPEVHREGGDFGSLAVISISVSPPTMSVTCSLSRAIRPTVRNTKP